MNFKGLRNDKITLEISLDELRGFNNALNEVCNGIEVDEFDKNIGMDEESVRGILKSIRSFYHEAKAKQLNDETEY